MSLPSNAKPMDQVGSVALTFSTLKAPGWFLKVPLRSVQEYVAQRSPDWSWKSVVCPAHGNPRYCLLNPSDKSVVTATNVSLVPPMRPVLPISP